MYASKRLRTTTKQLEKWVHLVTIAQAIRIKELEDEQRQQKLNTYDFQQVPPAVLWIPKIKLQKRIQQDMRVFLLNSEGTSTI